MDLFSATLIILGLVAFETISSIDNAVINAEVLSGMSKKARKWFLFWGLIFGVFLVRGVLPFLIIFLMNPSLGVWGTITAAFSQDPHIAESVEQSAPYLLMGGGVFLLLLFFHWLFLEPKHFGLRGEKFFYSQGVWFYAIASAILATLVWFSLKEQPFLAFSAVVGSTGFFITHGFKQNAEEAEQGLATSAHSDIAKILYLEAIDATFSIDGVLGAFAFTLSVPLILLGNGIGAVVVRQITIGNIERIKKYLYLKNGAMYSIFCLGIIMIMDAFGYNIPHWLSPTVTFAVLGFFFLKSRKKIALQSAN